MTAYYNEFDPKAAAWLRELIARGLIAPGDVDDRSIVDVRPDDLRGYTQAHFFAGIGVWSHALRSAGWSDDRPVWTGSCPCQPFSAAGKGKGFADDRHLWPAFFNLIRECRPDIVLGEQVASKDGLAWLDLVHADLEGADYAVGAVDTCAAGFGAPHIRQRLWWVGVGQADSDDAGLEGRRVSAERAGECVAGPGGVAGGVADASSLRERADQPCPDRRNGIELAGSGPGRDSRHDGTNAGLMADAVSAGRAEGRACPGLGQTTRSGGPGLMADAAGERLDRIENPARPDGRDCSEDRSGNGRLARPDAHDNDAAAGPVHAKRARARWMDDNHGDGSRQAVGGVHEREPGADGSGVRPGPVNGFWSDADWLSCRDGRWRAVEARPQPLVDGSAQSLGRVCPETVAQIEREVDAIAAAEEADAGKILRDLQATLRADAKRCWATSGIPGLHEAPFLLAFMRQLTEQGWRFSESLSLSREEGPSGELRGLRCADPTAGSPCERGLDGQSPRESADALHLLSSLLARHAHQAWDDAHAAYAEIGFPLGRDSRSRVARLRGYGNAIVAQAAEGFIASVMEALS